MANEKRLIDSNKLNVCYINTGTVMFPKMEAFVRADDIADAPTVDAVEVVRCKDCKHWSELNGKDSGKPVGYGDCRNHCGINGIAYGDSFCSYGERRTDNGC